MTSVTVSGQGRASQKRLLIVCLCFIAMATQKAGLVINKFCDVLSLPLYSNYMKLKKIEKLLSQMEFTIL